MKTITKFIFAITLVVGMVPHTPLYAVVHMIQVGNFFFNPSSLNVNVGDIIEWDWSAGSHTTTSATIPGGAASWDQPISSSNPTFQYTVTVAGTYDYVCTPHVAMGMVASFTATAAAPNLQVQPMNQNVGANAGSTNFTVTSNITWNASSNQLWCTVTASGTGNGTLTANYTQNLTTSSRVATITVSGTGVTSQVVTVTQAGAAPNLNIVPPVQNVGAQSGSTDFTVTSNGNWSASSDSSWCTVTPSGTGNGTLTADFSANPASTTRTATITVTMTGVTPKTVQVVQAGSTTGIPDYAGNSVSLYPNPARDQVTIDLNGIDDPSVRISVVDLAGRVLLDHSVPGNKSVALNLADFPKGYYFMKIWLSTGTIVRKFIIAD